MDNVLPAFKTFHLEKDVRKKQEKNRQWNPNDSLPRIKNGKSISFMNDEDERINSRPNAVTSYHISNSAPPNKKYLVEKPLQEDDTIYVSPLSNTERGEKVPAIMKHNSTTVMRRDPTKYQTVPQALNVENGGGVNDIHIFFTGTKIRAVDLREGHSELRYINGTKFKENMTLNQNKLMDFYVATTLRIASVMSLRQEIYVFEFQPGPLGIEVQLKNGKLCCASVFPGSQAEVFSNLKDSEPLSINGTRVVTLSGFEKALGDAQQCQFSDVITIEALVLKKEKLPYEDMIGVNLKNKKMSNLFKVLNKGGKSAKRGRRFQNMSLAADSDDDDEEDTLTAGGDDKVDGQITADEVKNTLTEDTLEANVACAQEKEKDEKGVWQFVSENDNKEDTPGGDDVLAAERKTVDSFDSDLISPSKDWKSCIDDDAADNGEKSDDDFDEDDEDSVNSVQAALLASPHRHRETGVLMQAIALGIEPITPPVIVEVEEPIVEEESLEEQTDATSASAVEELGITSAGWDYATALEGGDLTAHLKLICVPSRICSSQNGWGEPSQSSFMNFTNMSSKWDIELFWVGEDSALISRSIMEQNENHVELLSSDHVWCLTARRHDIDELENVAVVTDDDVEVQGMSSVSILFRPPKKTAENVIKRCVRVMWIPWVSLSFAETSTQMARNDINEYPDVDFKIFDHHHSEEDKGRKK